MTKRLEIIVKLKELEEQKESLDGALNDVSDFFTKKISITIQMDGMHRYRQEYNGYPIDVNKVALTGFLKLERDRVEEQINKLIGEL